MEILGRPVFDASTLPLFLVDLLVNLTTAAIIVGWIYLPSRRDREHAFMLMTLNVVVFFVASTMSRFQLGIGFAFGLFAMFGILRYRTETVPVAEMSYLFALLAIAVINGVAHTQITYTELFLANALIALMLFAMDRIWRAEGDSGTITYDNLANVHRDNQAQLLADIGERTGLDVHRVEVRSINLTSGSARVRFFYTRPKDD